MGYPLGYVIGVLVGDGSLHRSIDYHYFDEHGRQVPKAKSVRRVPRYRYVIALDVMDEDFRDTFANNLWIMTHKHICRWKTKRGEYRAVLVSIDWYNTLLPYKAGLDWIEKADLETKRGFLRGMFDSEGCVTKREYGHRVSLTNKNIDLLKLCQKLLAEHGIVSTIRIKKSGVGDVRFGAKDSITRFKSAVNFSIKRKRDLLELSA